MHVEINKILGCLIGAAAADAMGAATEVRTQQQIREYFGGWVTGFEKPPPIRLAAVTKPACAPTTLFRRSTSWTLCYSIIVR